VKAHSDIKLRSSVFFISVFKR